MADKILRLGETADGQPITLNVSDASLKVLGQSLAEALSNTPPRVGYLAYSRNSCDGGLSAVSITPTLTSTGPGQKYYTDRPCLLIPITSTVAGGSYYSVQYSPSQPGNKTTAAIGGGTYALQAPKGVIWLWAPGWYYIRIASDSPVPIPFAILPTEDTLVVDQFLSPSENFEITDEAEVPLSAATVSQVYPGLSALAVGYVRLENTGANPLRYTFGSEVPSATLGSLLAPNGVLELRGSAVPNARLRVFSTLGTTYMLRTGGRSYG